MASPSVFFNDRALGATVTCTVDHDDYPVTNLITQDPQSLAKFTANNAEIVFSLGGAYPIGGIGIANHNCTGTLTVAALGLSETMPTTDCVFLKSGGTDASVSSVTVQISGTSGKTIGAISLFPQATDAGVFTALARPLIFRRTHHTTELRTRRGRIIRQSHSASSTEIELIAAQQAFQSAGDPGFDAWDGFTDFGHQGAWFIDDSYSSGTPAWYGVFDEMTREIHNPSGRGNIRLMFREFPR